MAIMCERQCLWTRAPRPSFLMSRPAWQCLQQRVHRVSMAQVVQRIDLSARPVDIVKVQQDWRDTIGYVKGDHVHGLWKGFLW